MSVDQPSPGLKFRRRLTLSQNYRIRSIRRHGYYLFQHSILCGFFSRAAAIKERRLFNSVKTFCKYTCTKSTDVSTNGTEDDKIHYLKEGGVAVDFRETAKRDTATLTSRWLAAPLEADDVDPFTDIEENEEELN